MGIRKLDKGSHSRGGRGQWACLDKGCLGERTQRTRICISTPRKMAGIRGTPYNFSVDQPKAPSVRKGMARRSGLLGSLFSSVPQAGSAAQGVHLFFAASLTTHTSRRQAPPSKLWKPDWQPSKASLCLVWAVPCLRYCFFKRFFSAGIGAHASPPMPS